MPLRLRPLTSCICKFKLIYSSACWLSSSGCASSIWPARKRENKPDSKPSKHGKRYDNSLDEYIFYTFRLIRLFCFGFSRNEKSSFSSFRWTFDFLSSFATQAPSFIFELIIARRRQPRRANASVVCGSCEWWLIHNRCFLCHQ